MKKVETIGELIYKAKVELEEKILDDIADWETKHGIKVNQIYFTFEAERGDSKEFIENIIKVIG